MEEYEIQQNIHIWSTIKEFNISDNRKLVDISFNNDTRLTIEYNIFGFYDKEFYNIFLKIDKNILNELKISDDFIDSVTISSKNNENTAIINIVGNEKDYPFKIYNIHDGNFPIEIICSYNECSYNFFL